MIKICKTCKKEFLINLHKQKKNQVFCSVKCIRNKTQFLKGHKNRLGKKPPERAWNNAKSKKSRFSFGHKANLGRTPWNKDKDFGGNETLKRKIMGLSRYKTWRNEIKTRDNYKCVRCGLKDVKLEVDHYPILFSKILKENDIKNVDDAKKCLKIWDKENARTLCKHCHKEVTYWQQATRDNRKMFMDTLIELAEKDSSICLIIPDVGFSYIDEFAKRFPDRFFNFGVTEQSCILIACGLALSGMKPYVYSMINFVLFRPYEMVRNGVVHHNANVKLLGVKGSTSYTFLGFSHNMTDEEEDVRTCKNLGLDYYIPDSNENVRKVILGTYESEKPAYIRL